MNRKHIILAIIALSFLTICGCDNSELLYEQEEIEVPIPKHGYIFFSIRNTNSRGTTIMDKTSIGILQLLVIVILQLGLQYILKLSKPKQLLTLIMMTNL